MGEAVDLCPLRERLEIRGSSSFPAVRSLTNISSQAKPTVAMPAEHS